MEGWRDAIFKDVLIWIFQHCGYTICAWEGKHFIPSLRQAFISAHLATLKVTQNQQSYS